METFRRPENVSLEDNILHLSERNKQRSSDVNSQIGDDSPNRSGAASRVSRAKMDHKRNRAAATRSTHKSGTRLAVVIGQTL